ncbi:hypothetical protein FKM82_008296 [Ascaphus truei]
MVKSDAEYQCFSPSQVSPMESDLTHFKNCQSRSLSSFDCGPCFLILIPVHSGNLMHWVYNGYLKLGESELGFYFIMTLSQAADLSALIFSVAD